MAKWMYNFCGWCPDHCMMHRALLYCGYTEFYQLSCVSEMFSWFSVQSWKALGFRQWWKPGQDLRVLIMSVINIFHFQVALVCLPLHDVSAESQDGLSTLVSLIFHCWGLSKEESEEKAPSVTLHELFLPGSELRLLSLTHNTKLLPFLCSKPNIFRKYQALLSSSITGRNLWSCSISEAQTQELPGSSANLFTSGWMLTLM